LFIGTQKDNMQDCKNKNRLFVNKGENNGNKKLTEEQVLEIFKMSGTQKDIANKFGICRGAVCDIKRGINWGWLTCKLM
jgi:hypothetical protein